MRYEDIAFLTEAFAERVAIASTQGTLSFETVSDLAKSNNVVRPEIVKRSFPSALTYYIAPSNELITGPNAVYTSRSGSEETIAFTNSYVFYRPHLAVEGTTGTEIHELTNYIYQVISNTVTDVHTNDLTMNGTHSGIYSNDVVVYRAITNLHTLSDYCFSNTNSFQWADLKSFIAKRRYSSSIFDLDIGKHDTIGDQSVYSISHITNLYSVARRCRQISPRSVTSTHTNEYNCVRSQQTSYGYYSTTNMTRSTFSQISTRMHSADRAQTKDEDGNWEDEPNPSNTNSWSRIRYEVGPLVYTLKTWIPEEVDTFRYVGSGSGRIASAHAFAVVSLSYKLEQESYASQEKYSFYRTNESAKVIYPVDATRIDAIDGMISFTASILDARTMFEACADEAGITWPGANALPVLPEALSAEWAGTTDYRRYLYSDEYASFELNALIEGFYIVIDTRPSTVLTTWGEYQ